MQPIIDAHGHLGDILYPGGGELIGRLGVEMADVFDPASLAERQLHRDPLHLGKLAYRLFARQITRGERARNATATLENFGRSLDESQISHGVCLPIPPHVGFADLAEARSKDPRIVPFTGVDFTGSEDGSLEDPTAQLAADVAAGARGLKLHPIIQKIPLTSPATRAAVDAFAPHGLPVLFHCGVSSYYLGAERVRQEPRYGAIHYAAELVRDFPAVRFIAGHSGLMQVDQLMEQLAGFSNVWVDTSFQSPERIGLLVQTFGADRVLFASDWPYGNRPPALTIIREACRGDHGLERQILFSNAAELMGIDA
ncbi:MAG: amidohydrolase [bacterium]|nr:amidohydrolase [bacterium]MCP5065581.1 amidohydrolase [bacterium]